MRPGQQKFAGSLQNPYNTSSTSPGNNAFKVSLIFIATYPTVFRPILQSLTIY